MIAFLGGVRYAQRLGEQCDKNRAEPLSVAVGAGRDVLLIMTGLPARNARMDSEWTIGDFIDELTELLREETSAYSVARRFDVPDGYRPRKPIDAFAARRPDLKQSLQRPGAFLDVGSGAGWLAIEAAQSWPALRTVGIDPWEPALNLARANIAAAGLDGRIELRLQRIEELPDQDEFTLVWLPGPFLPPEIVTTALERIHRALRPDGWVVFGLFGTTPDPLGEALTALGTVRSGGHPWTTTEVEQRLRDYGFEQIESSPPGLPTLLVVGKKPDQSRASMT